MQSPEEDASASFPSTETAPAPPDAPRAGAAESAVLLLGGLIGLLPWRLAVALGSSGQFFSWLLPKRKKARTIRNLELAGSAAPSVSKAARSLGVSLLEMFWCTARSREQILDRLEVEGLEDLREAHAEGRGVLVASAHFGNWEMVGAATALAGPVSVVARRLRTSGVERRILDMRTRLGVKTLMRNEKGSSIAVSRALARGGILAVMMDRNSSGRRLLVPFLGQGMMMPVGPALLAHRFGSAVFVGLARRDEDDRTKVVLRRVQAEAAADGEALARLVAAALEVEVREAPEQWYWISRRHKEIGAPAPD